MNGQTDGTTGEWMDRRLNGWIKGRMNDGWMNGRMDELTDGWTMDGWMLDGWMVDGWMDG